MDYDGISLVAGAVIAPMCLDINIHHEVVGSLLKNDISTTIFLTFQTSNYTTNVVDSFVETRFHTHFFPHKPARHRRSENLNFNMHHEVVGSLVENDISTPSFLTFRTSNNTTNVVDSLVENDISTPIFSPTTCSPQASRLWGGVFVVSPFHYKTHEKQGH